MGKASGSTLSTGRYVHTKGVTRLIGIESTFGEFQWLAGSMSSLCHMAVSGRRRDDILAGWPLGWRTWVVRGLAIYPVLGVVSVVLTNSRAGIINLGVFAVLWSFERGLR